VAFATKTLDFAVASGDVSLEVDALIHRGVAELHRGAVSAARRDVREARGSLRDRPPTPASSPGEVASVLLAVLDGELALAAERVESAYALGRKVGHADARLYRDLQRFQLAYLHGSLAELGESGLAEAAAKSHLLGVRIVAALMYAEADRIRQVRPILGRLVEEAAEAPRDTGWLSNLSLLALVAARVRDERSAAELRELLDPYEPYVVSAFCVVSNGPVPLFLGLLDGVLGHTERAQRHLRDAVSRNEEMRIEPWLCLSKIALAECAHDTDGADAEAALHHARGARRLAQGMGMRRAEERAAAVLRRLRGELATPLDPSEP
jgi:hypothetical protein